MSDFRELGNDFAILRLGARGVIRGLVIDTSYVKGNHPESASLEGVRAMDGRGGADAGPVITAP